MENFTKLLPQETSDFISLADYETLPFRWGIDAPTTKAMDLNLSENYWLTSNSNIILSIATDHNSDTGYKNKLLKKSSYALPELLPENVSEIALARYSNNDSLRLSNKQQIYWENGDCIHLSLTEAEIIYLSEHLLPNPFHGYDEMTFVETRQDIIKGFPEFGEQYVWHFRLYCNDSEGLYYNPGNAFLCRTSSNQYFISYDDGYYSWLPDGINKKLQNAFADIDFGKNTHRF